MIDISKKGNMNMIGQSPQIIAFDYYDGPTNGVLKLERTGQEYQFDCVVSISQNELDLRAISLYPLPVGTFDNVAHRLYIGAPLQKVSVVFGDFYKQVEAEADAIYRDIELCKGALEKVVAWYDPGLVILAETTNKEGRVAIANWLNAIANCTPP